MTEEVTNPIHGMMDGDRLIIANVTFSPEVVEIDFFDPRRQGDGIVEFTKIAVERRLAPTEVDQIEELVEDLIDEALRQRRK